jgi:predicted DNA-binding transcriptional regulator AlpA
MSSTEVLTHDPPAGEDGMTWRVPDVAKFLGVSEAAIRKCVAQGLIPARRHESDWRFSEAAIRQWQLGRGGRNSTGDYLTPKELLMRWAGAWADEPPFLNRDPSAEVEEPEAQ